MAVDHRADEERGRECDEQESREDGPGERSPAGRPRQAVEPASPTDGDRVADEGLVHGDGGLVGVPTKGIGEARFEGHALIHGRGPFGDGRRAGRSGSGCPMPTRRAGGRSRWSRGRRRIAGREAGGRPASDARGALEVDHLDRVGRVAARPVVVRRREVDDRPAALTSEGLSSFVRRDRDEPGSTCAGSRRWAGDATRSTRRSGPHRASRQGRRRSRRPPATSRVVLGHEPIEGTLVAAGGQPHGRFESGRLRSRRVLHGEVRHAR